MRTKILYREPCIISLMRIDRRVFRTQSKILDGDFSVNYFRKKRHLRFLTGF